MFRFWLFFVLKFINSSQFHYYIIIRMCRYLLVTWGVYFTVAFSQYSQQTISILLVYTLLNITKLHNICSISNTSNIYRLDTLSYYIQHSTIFFSRELHNFLNFLINFLMLDESIRDILSSWGWWAGIEITNFETPDKTSDTIKYLPDISKIHLASCLIIL